MHIMQQLITLHSLQSNLETCASSDMQSAGGVAVVVVAPSALMFKLMQAKLTCMNSMYTFMYKFIKAYSNNLLAMDMCAASRTLLVEFFGQPVCKIVLMYIMSSL
jgi:hypothetical protein